MKLKVLTPIHIGDGEEIIPWEYEISGKKLKVYSFENLLNELSKKYSGISLKNIFKKLKEDIRINGFKKTLGDFLRENRISAEPLYVVEDKANLKREDEFKSIKSFIKTGGKVYIPGSEVKGALRTIFIFGVVYNELQNKNFRSINFIVDAVKSTLENSENPRENEVWKKVERKVENYFFLRGAPENDAKYDIFKILKVSDSLPKNTSESIYIDEITIVGTRRNFNDPHELLKEGAEFEINIQIDEEGRKALKKVSKNPYIDFVNLDFLKESAYNFYRFLFSEEEEFFKNLGINRALEDIENLKYILNEKPFLIRIGKHQGFLSITFMLIVKLASKNLYREFYGKVISKPGKPVNKTRKITKDGRILGFCSLEI